MNERISNLLCGLRFTSGCLACRSFIPFTLSTNQKSTSYISKGLVVMHCHALSCGRLFSFVSMICSDSHSIYFIVCVCLHDTDGPFRSSLYLKKCFIGKGRFPDQRGQSINRVHMHWSDACTSRKRMCCIYGINPTT